MKKTIALLLLITISTPLHSDCVTFIGMSQTRDACDGMNRVGANNFVCLWSPGKEIDDFAVASTYFNLRERHNNCGGLDPFNATKVAIQLSAPTQNRAQILNLTEQVVDEVRSLFRQVREIELITASGGPGGALCEYYDGMRNRNSQVCDETGCYVRSSYQYATFEWHGMLDYANSVNGVSVYPSEVCACTNYRDMKGHFTGAGDRCVGRDWRDHILTDGSPTPPDPEPNPDPEPKPEPDPTCPTVEANQTLYQACYLDLGYKKPFTTPERRDIKACLARCQ